MNLRIALVDDEQECLDEIAAWIKEFGTERKTAVEIFPFTSAEAFLKALSENRFDVVMLDIYMEGMDGVGAATRLREEDKSTELIFLTSSTDFMPDAFSLHAFDYVIKPVNPERLAAVFSDLLERLPAPERYIEVASGRRAVRIFLNQIISVITDAHYLDITLVNGKRIRSRMTMKEFMKRIENDPRFLTINKGIAVNAEGIVDFENGCCVLENGVKLPVRVRDYREVEQAARDYHFEKIRSRQRRRKEEQ